MKKIILFTLLLFSTVVWGYCTCANDYSDKIVFEGFGKYVDMSTSQQIKNVIQEDKIETLKMIVVGKTDFKYDVGLVENLTHEEADKIQLKRRTAGASYYKEFNQKLMESLPQANYLNIYVSKYFPQITFDMKSEEILSSKSTLLNTMAKNDMIEKIYVQNSQDVTDYIVGSKDLMNVTPELYNGTLTGRGVKVGLLDGGIVDEDNTNFESTDLVCRDEWYFIETESDHATAMASCIGGKEGIARQASIYSVQAFGNPSGELDWLIDNGVNIINCSYGYGDADGIYSSHSATYDYLIWTYGITVIAASGNESSGETDYYVSNPGLAYNAITVGGALDTVMPWSGTCYEEVTNVDKPTIVNAASNIDFNNAMSGSGTSYSCAFTSGCAALLMEYCPDLKVYPAKLTALMSGCSHRIGGNYALESGLDDVVGCGLMNFEMCKVSINNCMSTTTSSNSQADDFVIDQRFYLEAGNKVRIAVAWNGKSGDSVESWQLNNYTLCLFRPSGAQIACSYSLYNNVLLIQYETEYTGNYRLVLLQEGDLVHTDPTNIFVYYSVWPSE